MNLVCLNSYKNLLGQAILKEFLSLGDTKVIIFQESYPEKNHEISDSQVVDALKLSITDEGFEAFIKDSLSENNIFIFNSNFIDEMKQVGLSYSQAICDQLNELFKSIKLIISILNREGKSGKFLFITTNPGISHSCNFPTSPIYDEALHALIRSLAKEFKSSQIAFHGICTESIFEMVDKSELRDYRRKMKVYAMQKSPVKLAVLVALIKNLALTDFRLTSGNILYVAEGLDQVNF